MKNKDIKEKEKQHAAAYARNPVSPDEIAEWEAEQVWLDDEPFGHAGAIPQTSSTVERAKAMAEALEKAAEIRHQLEGRHHSDSTQDLREDRER